MSDEAEDQVPPSAAQSLEGHVLEGGWRVRQKLPAGETPGTFCVHYLVDGPSGEKAFCKALDLAAAIAANNSVATLSPLVKGFEFEQDLLRRCDGLSKVIRAIDDGETSVPGLREKVPYIIFEQAEFDLRRGLDLIENLGTAGRLLSLQNAATGLKQLHGKRVAHQDVKPSNVLFLHKPVGGGPRITKIGDLGRAFDEKIESPFDDMAIAGDLTFAPPEQRYGAIPATYEERRLACDVYQFGSLISFVMCGSPMNALLQAHIGFEHSWSNNQGPQAFAEMLPYIRDAFGRSLRKVRENSPKPIAEQICQLVTDLCEPDPQRRGHRGNPRGPHTQYDMSRVVTDLNRLYYNTKRGLTA